MNSAELIFTNSPWWIAIALMAGLGYAWLLYTTKGPWSNTTKKILFALRTLAIALIILLLINPLLKRAVNTTVPPIAVVLFDNSSSIPLSVGENAVSTTMDKVKTLSEALTTQGYDVKWRSLDGEVPKADSIRSNYETSNLSNQLGNLPDQYGAKDLSMAILVSDGIYNQGVSPDFKNFVMPVHTVGIGDTIPKKDIILKDVRYNKVAYLDNQFPVSAEVLQNGYKGLTAIANLRKNGQIIDTKSVIFNQDRSFHTVEFIVTADQAGINRYEVVLSPQNDEQSTVNNRKNIYIDIINNKDKILILASSPHPDIKAIKRVLELNKNYEVFDYIPGVNEFQNEPYSLVIAHQPFAGNRSADNQLKALLDKEVPVWYILGEKTRIPTFNETNQIVELTQSRGQFDNVGPAVNKEFGKFTLAETDPKVLNELPPIAVPYGNTRLKAPAEVLLKQKIGSIVSERPLLVVNNSTERKEAVLIGAGIWSWRIMEASRNDNTTTFNAIFSKLIQYLNTKEDKRKFRVTTSSDEYNDSENVVFNTDVYNDIYEKIYNVAVQLTVTDEQGNKQNFSYVTSQGNSDYQIGGLKPGAYRYTASATVNGEKELVSGGFSVVKLQIESINLTADFELLKRLSAKTGGSFVTTAEVEQLQQQLTAQPAQGILYTEERFSQLIELRWILLFITALFSAEWFIRKFSGGY